MSGAVNLNRAHKKKARADKDKRAGENRAKFGRTKGEKIREAAQQEQAKRVLDGHKREDD